MTTLTTYLLYRGKGFAGEGGADTGIELPDDFAGIDAPKSLFLFTMNIRYRNPALNQYIDRSLKKLGIPLKTATRPEPTIEYMDVNYYNFRTKVPVKVDLGTATVTMYDDSRNKAHALVTQMFAKMYQPITAGSLEDADDGVEFEVISTDDMVSTNLGIQTGASYGKVADSSKYNTNGPIEYIDINHHHYNGNIDSVVIYRYLNPKIVSFSMDALDMSSSDPSTVTFSFNYDALRIFNDGTPTASITPNVGDLARAPDLGG